jgi:hypothetical protein
LCDESDRVAGIWFRKANPGQPEPAIVYQRVTDGLKEILLVDRLSERTAAIDDQGVRELIGAFGVQTVLLLGFSVPGSAEEVPCQIALGGEEFES